MKKQKVEHKLFDDSIRDPSKPIIYVGKAIGAGLTMGAIATTAALYGGFSIHEWSPQSTYTPLTHTLMYWNMWLAKAMPVFHTKSLDGYFHWIDWVNQNGQGPRLFFRQVIPTLIGGVTTYKTTKKMWTPMKAEKQTGGRELLESSEAYETLKRLFWNQIKNDNGRKSFPLESDIGFHPLNLYSYEKLNDDEQIIVPDSQRRQHWLVIGSSRRGKTQFLQKRVMWIYYKIRTGELFKLLLIDTPKNDYSKFIPEQYMHTMSIDEKTGMYWDIAYDLILKQDAEQFVYGKISTEGVKDPFWPQRARAIVTACIVYLQETAGTDWDMGSLAGVLKKPNEEIADIIENYYPEALKTIQLNEQTLSSIMGAVEDATTDFLQIGEIYNGFKYKKDIEQLNVKMLKHEHHIERLTDKLFPTHDYGNLKDGQPTPIFENFFANRLFARLIDQINEEKCKDWTWSDLKNYLSSSYRDIVTTAYKKFEPKEKEGFFALHSARKVISSHISKITNQSFSSDEEIVKFCDHLLPIKEILNTQANYSLRAIIRGNNLELDVAVLSQLLKDWEEKNVLSIADLICENLSSNELSRFFDQDHHKVLLEGCKPIFELAEIWDKFEATPKLSIRDWVLDENPEKKILCLKTSARFQSLTTPILKGILFMIKGLVLDKFYPDDKSDTLALRNFWIFADEFQELGNISEFIAPMMALGASRGITLLIAMQDLAQLESKGYDANFVKFLVSNTGNLIICGVNQGDTGQRFSDLIGKKDISKTHESVSYSAQGKSYSVSIQQHEGLVIRPSDINAKLGLDLNSEPIKLTWLDKLLGREKAMPNIRYLYLPSNCDPAFILETPVCSYKVVNTPKEAEWMTSARHKKPAVVDFNNLLKIGSRDMTDDHARPKKTTFKKINQWVVSEPAVDTEEQDLAVMEDIEEMREEEYSLTDEELDYRQKAIDKESEKVIAAAKKSSYQAIADLLDENSSEQ